MAVTTRNHDLMERYGLNDIHRCHLAGVIVCELAAGPTVRGFSDPAEAMNL
jgi:hypothetical protein